MYKHMGYFNFIFHEFFLLNEIDRFDVMLKNIVVVAFTREELRNSSLLLLVTMLHIVSLKVVLYIVHTVCLDFFQLNQYGFHQAMPLLHDPIIAGPSLAQVYR